MATMAIGRVSPARVCAGQNIRAKLIKHGNEIGHAYPDPLWSGHLSLRLSGLHSKVCGCWFSAKQKNEDRLVVSDKVLKLLWGAKDARLVFRLVCFNICFGCSKEPSQRVSKTYMFW